MLRRNLIAMSLMVLVGCNLFTRTEDLSDAGRADAGSDDDASNTQPGDADNNATTDLGADATLPDGGGPLCGNGVVDGAEQCDRGMQNANTPNADCRTNCRSRRCGDGVIDDAFSERCDDGNRRSHDQCSSTCQEETLTWTRIDGVHDVGNHAAAYDSDRDVIVVFSGRNASAPRSNETWEFDGTNWSRINTANAPSPRFDAKMVYDSAAQRVVLFGGNTDDGLSAETWAYSGGNWNQLSPTTVPPARSDHGLVWVPGADIAVMFGGEAATGQFDDLWVFDGTDWTERAPGGGQKPSAREEIVLVASGTDVLLHGGEDETARFDELWSYDASSTNGQWTLLDSGGTRPMSDHQGTLLPGGDLFVMGGHRADTDAPTNDAYRWNGTSWSAVSGTGMWPPERRSFQMVSDGSRVLVIGGGYFSAEWLGDVWAYDGSWSVLASDHPTGRFAAAGVYDAARRRVVVTGGSISPDNVIGDTVELASGDALWTQGDPGPRRRFAAMAYDAEREVSVMFGGADESNGRPNETWLYDGTWTQASPAASPPAMHRAAVAYDSMRGRVLIATSCNSLPDDALETVWSWDGATWTALPSIPDEIWCDPMMAYDSARDRVVLVGFDGTNTRVFEFDGTAWSDVAATELPGRTRPGVVYDPLAERVLVFGGRELGEDIELNDLWSWDGTTWEEGVPTGGPPGNRDATVMVYDSTRRASIVTTGFDDSTKWFDTWTLRWENPATPEEVCTGGADDDSDLLVDCDDPDCDFHPDCTGQ